MSGAPACWVTLPVDGQVGVRLTRKTPTLFRAREQERVKVGEELQTGRIGKFS